MEVKASTQILVNKQTFGMIESFYLHFHIAHNAFKLGIGDLVSFVKVGTVYLGHGEEVKQKDIICARVLNVISEAEGLMPGYFIFEFTT